MRDGENISEAWNGLEKLVEKGFAVAFRKAGQGFHVRAVREEKVIEGESETMTGAMIATLEETKRGRSTNIRSKG